jgi:hypothetical protein
VEKDGCHVSIPMTWFEYFKHIVSFGTIISTHFSGGVSHIDNILSWNGGNPLTSEESILSLVPVILNVSPDE